MHSLQNISTNWYLAGRQNVSFRTSPQTGVGISIEFLLAHRHTVCPFLYNSPEFIHGKLYFYSGDCHASVRYFIAMTGNSINSQFTVPQNETERVREKRQHKSGARQACGAAADTERVVLHAVNQNPNDCRGQSYHN